MYPLRLMALSLFFWLSAAPTTQAQDTGRNTVCRDDIMKLCKSERPGNGQMVACLEKHQDQLTPACQTALPKMSQCAQEVRQLCNPQGNANPRELRSCLRERSKEVSPQCQGTLPQR